MHHVAKRLTPALYAVVLLAVLAGGSVLYFGGGLTERELSGSLLTMLSTFLGALFAFRLNERKDDMKSSKERREELNKALFVLARQTNTALNLKLELAKYETDFERAFNCPPLRPASYDDVSINYGALGFVLESEPSLLMEVAIVEEGFHQALRAIHMRSEFLVAEVQPAIASNQLNRKVLTMRELEAALGERLTQGAFNVAEVMYKLVLEAAEQLPHVHAKLFEAAKAAHPGFEFVRLAPNGQSAA